MTAARRRHLPMTNPLPSTVKYTPRHVSRSTVVSPPDDVIWKLDPIFAPSDSYLGYLGLYRDNGSVHSRVGAFVRRETSLRRVSRRIVREYERALARDVAVATISARINNRESTS